MIKGNHPPLKFVVSHNNKASCDSPAFGGFCEWVVIQELCDGVVIMCLCVAYGIIEVKGGDIVDEKCYVLGRIGR